MDNISFCIEYLKEVNNIKNDFNLSKENTLRALMNITMPYNLSDEFYLKQDMVLKHLSFLKKNIKVCDIPLVSDKIALFKGDITTIYADAIVNACNSKLLGCFSPLHSCIDNAIHSFAGLEVRRDLLEVMDRQGHDEANGLCKVTKGYNLPSKYIFHTVGPIYKGILQNEIDLANCYKSCLRMANEMNLESIVFPSLSTGVYGYPIDKASDIAIGTVKEFLKNENKSLKKVVFNLFKEGDYNVYYRKIKGIN